VGAAEGLAGANEGGRDAGAEGASGAAAAAGRVVAIGSGRIEAGAPQFSAHRALGFHLGDGVEVGGGHGLLLGCRALGGWAAWESMMRRDGACPTTHSRPEDAAGQCQKDRIGTPYREVGGTYRFIGQGRR
jgi:hypothetical protein